MGFNGWTPHTTLEDIQANPEAFGVPTFEDFSRNRKKFVRGEEDTLEQVERGSQNLGKIAKKYIFEIEGYRCKTLEEVQRVASSQGIPMKELDYTAQIVPIGGGNGDILVKFMSKAEKQRRELEG